MLEEEEEEEEESFCLGGPAVGKPMHKPKINFMSLLHPYVYPISMEKTSR